MHSVRHVEAGKYEVELHLEADQHGPGGRRGSFFQRTALEVSNEIQTVFDAVAPALLLGKAARA